MELNQKKWKECVLSFPDSQKMLSEALKRDMAISDLVYAGAFDTRKQAIEAVNKLLIETAKKKGMSLYDLCFNTVPEYDCSSAWHEVKDPLNVTVIGDMTVRLVPIKFDLVHDGGYWKNKYYKLKKKMQELIDSKEE